jgi:hypothetical protein
MLIVREVFTAKPGMASRLAKMFQEMAKEMPPPKPARVMTDFVGDYNTVVMEFEYADMAAYQKAMEEYVKMPAELRQKFGGYTELYMTGRREIFQIL